LDKSERLSNILVTLFNNILKMEEAILRQSDNHNLSITETHTLEAIGEGNQKTMTHVAATLKISVSTLTAAINKLVAKGYVNRFRAPEDKRVVRIELTETGVSAVRQQETLRLAILNDALSHLSPEEADKFISSLEHINEVMVTRRVNPIRQKEISLTPDRIYQGGMSIGISMSRLAAAVAIQGGVGVIAALHAGFNEEDFETNPVEANTRALRRHIQEALAAVRTAGGKGLIGINLPSIAAHYETYIRTALEAGAQVIISGGGVPTALPGICKNRDIKLVPVVSSARAASVIIRNWAKKHNRAPDAIIFQGPFAGGHLGYNEARLGPASENFYTMIAAIKAELENCPDCALIVGGGIYNKQDAQRVLACGADGVQIGSRFVTAKECDAPDAFKQAYWNCEEDDIAVIQNMTGMMDRVIRNKLIERLQTGRIPIRSCDGCLSTCHRLDAPYCLKEVLVLAARGDTENGLLFCGSKTHKADKIETVQDIFDEFLN